MWKGFRCYGCTTKGGKKNGFSHNCQVILICCYLWGAMHLPTELCIIIDIGQDKRYQRINVIQLSSWGNAFEKRCGKTMPVMAGSLLGNRENSWQNGGERMNRGQERG